MEKKSEIVEILRVALCYAANADTNLQNRSYTLASEDLFKQLKPYFIVAPATEKQNDR